MQSLEKEKGFPLIHCAEESLTDPSLLKDHQHVWYKPPGLSKQQITGTAQGNATFTKNILFFV